MHSMCNYTSAVRILNQNHRVKWISGHFSNFRYERQVLKQVCCSSRIFRTDSKLQGIALNPTSQNEQTRAGEENLCLPIFFLKDNFKIVDSRYFNLLTVSSENHNIEELLLNNEFKQVLSRSSFFYDVNLADNSQSCVPFSNIYYYSFEDIYNSTVNYSKDKSINSEFYEVLLSNSSHVKENDTGKPSEQQLLVIIDRLTHGLLHFFEKPHDFAIYHKNIVFQNNIKGVTIKGLSAYMQTMYFLKLYGYLQYTEVKVEILKITHHTEDGSVRVRWRVNGVSRHKVILNFWKLKTLTWQQFLEEEAKWLDGFSVFMVGPDGLIYKHICDKMTPSDETVKPKAADLKSRLLGLLDIAPRNPAAGSLNTLMPCYRLQDLISCKKLT